MTAETFASYCRRIRQADDSGELFRIRAELDRLHPHDADSKDSDALVKMATLKRVRLLESN